MKTKTKLPKKMIKKVAPKSTKKTVTRPNLYLGPLVAIILIITMLLTAKLLTSKKIATLPSVTPSKTLTQPESTSAQIPTLNPAVSIPPGWEKTSSSNTPEPTTKYVLDEAGSALYLGSRFALHESGDICGGEPPCVELGTFDANVAGKAFTTPLFLSKNRTTGQNKYIFQFRLYGIDGATYISGKVGDVSQLDTIRSFLNTFTIN